MYSIIDFLIFLIFLIGLNSLLLFPTTNNHYSTNKLEELKILNHEFSDFLEIDCNNYLKSSYKKYKVFSYYKTKGEGNKTFVIKKCFIPKK